MFIPLHSDAEQDEFSVNLRFTYDACTIAWIEFRPSGRIFGDSRLTNDACTIVWIEIVIDRARVSDDLRFKYER